MSLTVDFPLPAQLLNMNDRLHWRVRNDRTQEWRSAAYFAICSAIPDRKARAMNRTLVTVTLPVNGNRTRDPHNYAPTLKALVDGCRDAGCWPDDSSEFVATVEPRLEVNGESVRIELTEINEGTTP